MKSEGLERKIKEKRGKENRPKAALVALLLSLRIRLNQMDIFSREKFAIALLSTGKLICNLKLV